MNKYAIWLLSFFVCGICMVNSEHKKDFKYFDDLYQNLANYRGNNPDQPQTRGERDTEQRSMLDVKLDRLSNLQHLRTRSNPEKYKRSEGAFPIYHGVPVENCPSPETNLCLQFNISQGEAENLLKAELWVKQSGGQLGDPFKLSVWSPSRPDVKALVKPHWIKFNVAHIIHEWSMNPQQPQIMILSCSGCGINRLNALVFTEGEDRPMLNILTW